MRFHLLLAALFADLLFRSFLRRALRFHLLALRRFGLALGFDLFLLAALLIPLEFFALRLRGALHLLSLHLFLFGVCGGGIRGLFLPHRGGVRIGVTLADGALLPGLGLLRFSLRRSGFFGVHFLLPGIRLVARDRLLFADCGGTGFSVALPRHPLLIGLGFVRLGLRAAQFFRVHLLLLSGRLLSRGLRCFGCSLRLRGGGIRAGRMESSGHTVFLRLRPAAFARLSRHSADGRRVRRHDHRRILDRIPVHFRAAGFLRTARIVALALPRRSHDRIRRIERRHRIARHNGRILRAFFLHRLRRVGHRIHRRDRRDWRDWCDWVARNLRRLAVAFSARSFARENRRHRGRIGLRGHHFQVRGDHRFRRRGIGREPFRLALKPLPQIIALFPVLHSRPAVRHFVRGENPLHLVFQKRRLHGRRNDRRVDDELVPHGPRIR